MRTFSNYILIFFACSLGLFSCTSKKAEVVGPTADICDTTSVSYALDIKPILESNCQECHTIRSLTTSPVKEKLHGAVSHASGYPAMPLNRNKLPQCEIDLIHRWISNGAPDN